MENLSRSSIWNEHQRFAASSIILLITGCLGGITVLSGAIHSIWQLALVVFPTMMCLASILSVSPMKYVKTLFYISIVLDVLLILFNVIR